jgi:hypothetical protein
MQFGYSAKVDLHLEQPVAVAGDAPIAVGEEKEGILVDLVCLKGIDLGFDELLL